MIFGKLRRIGWSGCLVVLIAGGRLLAAVETVVNPRDTLVYKDGDRVQGVVVEKTKDLIVFKSDRFGELRVKADDAAVIPAEKPPEAAETKPAAIAARPKAAATPAESAKVAAQATEDAAESAANRAEQARITMWDRFTPGLLTAKVRSFFGPWHGKLSFSTEVVSDIAERNNHSLEARLTRKWKSDEVQLTGRYDYAETNNLATTDVTKVTGSWRHEFSKKWFAHYRPTAEWNHASKRKGVANDYLLLQQELGAGYHLYTTPARKIRLGISQNRFDIWNSAPTEEHTFRSVQSAFEEIELKLPWQMGLTQRGVWYPVSNQEDGWENRFELNKKLTETLSTAIRHEVRRNNPDGSAQDYTRLRLLFGLDF